ncbi:MAG: diguanylate cyclase [Spirochaetaceae bacterium]|nr:diguanylate cyclase [Spirochaetaceae bacterium]
MKNVFVPAGDRGVGAEVFDQLRIFGITVHEFAGADEVLRLARNLGGGVLLADAARIEREPAFVAELGRIKRELDGALRILFYSVRDDFETRLKAVRAGGEGFFQLPVDATRLADRIDGFLAESASEPFHVLIVDDDAEEVAFNALVLQEAGMITSVATDPSQVVPILVEAKPEIILMDMYMPGCSGSELAALIRQNEAFAAIPIIFLSVERDLEKQIGAIRRGGDEFLEKPIKPEHLVASVQMRAERTRSIRFFIERDSLTGLLNHTHLIERLGTEILRARRAGDVLSFAMIDLDRFKAVNDRYGHLMGDQVIKSLSRLLSERLRRTDVVGRYGGEEFGVILHGADTRRAGRIMDELREAFSQVKHRVDGSEFSVTLSCGIAGYPEYMSPTELVEAADRSLYRAKERGRNRIVLEDPPAV